MGQRIVNFLKTLETWNYVSRRVVLEPRIVECGLGSQVWRGHGPLLILSFFSLSVPLPSLTTTSDSH